MGADQDAAADISAATADQNATAYVGADQDTVSNARANADA